VGVAAASDRDRPRAPVSEAARELPFAATARLATGLFRQACGTYSRPRAAGREWQLLWGLVCQDL